MITHYDKEFYIEYYKSNGTYAIPREMFEGLLNDLKGYEQERMNLFKATEQLQKTIRRKDNGIKALTKDLCEESTEKEQLKSLVNSCQERIRKQNNILNELEEYLEQEYLEWRDCNNDMVRTMAKEDELILDKLKELRGNSNVED